MCIYTDKFLETKFISEGFISQELVLISFSRREHDCVFLEPTVGNKNLANALPFANWTLLRPLTLIRSGELYLYVL